MAKTFADAIFEAEKHSKQAPKHAALSGMIGDDLRLVQEALNPFRVFNVKKFDLPLAYANDDSIGYAYFFELLDMLEDRTLSGNAARLAITGVLSQYTERTAKALARVLIKDLKCGAGVSVLKAVYPHVHFPSFELMLAAKIEEKPQALRARDVVLTPAILAKKYGLHFPVIAEAKYDGNRMLAMVENGNVEFRSRNGLLIEWVTDVFDDELRAIEKYVGQPIVVDGEVLARSFQETSEAKGSKNLEAKKHLKFYAFDWMTLAAWRTQAKSDPQHRRSDQVLQFTEILNLVKIVKSKSRICYNIAELIAFYAEVLKDGQNADGTLNGLGEGLIIKHMQGVYEWDRSNFWFKWKPVIDVDLKVAGFEYGKAGSKNHDKLGGMLLEGHDENGHFINTTCGGFKVSGPELKKFIEQKAAEVGIVGKAFEDLNKDQFFRAYVMEHQDEFMGKTVMVEAQELTLAAGETVYSLRFPQFVRVRDDK